MGIEVTVRQDETDPPVDSRTATTLYRTVQEALTNVARHARATDVSIEIHQHDDELVVSIQDNGVGFPLSAIGKAGSYGLLGLRERAYMLGGRLEIDNPPGCGGRVTVRIPLGRPGTGPVAGAAPGPQGEIA
jgi:signal transduction histidine kinase